MRPVLPLTISCSTPDRSGADRSGTQAGGRSAREWPFDAQSLHPRLLRAQSLHPQSFWGLLQGSCPQLLPGLLRQELSLQGLFALGWRSDSPPTLEDSTLDSSRALELFLLDIEKRAFRIARITVRNDDDALDIVQDAMLQLARRYGKRPSEEWRPLFYRILQNRIRDCLRRRKVRSRVMAWLPSWGNGEDERQPDTWDGVADHRPQPPELLATDEAMQLLETSLAGLPQRQREAFVLRTLEGMDVAQTAQAMGCSEGSVKTHYSRAVHRLREQLGSAW